MQKRLAVWQKHTTFTSRRNRMARTLGLLLLVVAFAWVCFASYRGGWWPSLLDLVVVAIPTVLGFAAWVIPVKQTTSFHRWWLFVGGLSFSALIYLQQWQTRQEHTKEMGRLPADIAREIGKMNIFPSRTQPAVTTPPIAMAAPPVSQPKRVFVGPIAPKPADNPSSALPTETKNIEKGIQELKSLIVGQRCGLSAEQLVLLSRRLTPYASEINAWTGGGDLVTAMLGNPDSTKFAGNIIAALRSAGINQAGFSQAVFSGTPMGIIVQVHSRDSANIPALNQLVATFKEAGIDIHGEIQDGIPVGQFRIIVGAKPE